MSLPGHEKLPTVWPEKSQRAGDTIIYGLILYKSTLRIYYMSDSYIHGKRLPRAKKAIPLLSKILPINNQSRIETAGT